MKQTSLRYCAFALAGATLLVLNIGIVRGESSLDRFTQLKKSQTVLDKTVSRLENENQQLMKEIMRLKRSPDYARKVLRDKYHLTEDDEKIMFFPD